MRWAVFQVMALSLIRDKGALASVFILPGAVFVIFALIFSGTTGGSIDVKVAIGDLRQNTASKALVAALANEAGIRRVGGDELDGAGVRNFVRNGLADVGLIVRKDGARLDHPGSEGAAPLEIVTDPAREIAVSIFEGALQAAYPKALPDAPLRSVAQLIGEKFTRFTAVQRANISTALEAVRKNAGSEATTVEGEDFNVRLSPQTERVNVAGNPEVQSGISYYAGAVAIMFLLFSSVNGAMTLLEERESGLMDRLAIGPGGTGVLVDGKFLFLVLQGFFQIAAIYTVAAWGFGIDVLARFGPWAITTLLAAVAASGIALAFVLACRSRQQAQMLANIVILIISAIGGSMVPRYLMPQWIQDIGWLTPNTWTLEAYGAIFWRGETIQAMVLPWLALGLAGLAGLVIARFIAQRIV